MTDSLDPQDAELAMLDKAWELSEAITSTLGKQKGDWRSAVARNAAELAALAPMLPAPPETRAGRRRRQRS